MAKDDDRVRRGWQLSAGGRLRQERERLGISQAELARRLNVTRQLTNHWEIKGRSAFSAYDLARLQRMGFDPLFILTGTRSGGGAVSQTTDPRIAELEAQLAEAQRMIGRLMLEAKRRR
jgi:transcriptional regulator with XRE-family HTH domain